MFLFVLTGNKYDDDDDDVCPSFVRCPFRKGKHACVSAFYRIGDIFVSLLDVPAFARKCTDTDVWWA